MDNALRLIIGAIAGPVVGLLLVATFAPAHDQGPTATGMANIGYAVQLVAYVVGFGAAFGLAFPLLTPRAATKPIASGCVALACGALLLGWMALSLGLFDPRPVDRFAIRTLVCAAISMALSATVTYFLAFRGNRFLLEVRRPTFRR